MAEHDIFGEIQLAGIYNVEGVVQLIDEEIELLEEQLRDFPGPYDPLNGERYIQWERRAMLLLGGVQREIKLIRALQLVPAEVAAALQQKAVVMVSRLTATVISGARS